MRNGNKVTQKWSFNSTSNPHQKPYEVLQYADGSLSCNCVAWRFSPKNGGVRGCKHTRGVMALAQIQLDGAQLPDNAPVVPMPPKLAQATLSLHKRKLRWE